MSFSSGQTKLSAIYGCQFKQLSSEQGATLLSLQQLFRKISVVWCTLIGRHSFPCISSRQNKQLFVLSQIYNLFNNLLTFWKTFWGWTIVNTVFAGHVTWTVQDKSFIADKHVIYAKFRIISEHDAIC